MTQLSNIFKKVEGSNAKNVMLFKKYPLFQIFYSWSFWYTDFLILTIIEIELSQSFLELDSASKRKQRRIHHYVQERRIKWLDYLVSTLMNDFKPIYFRRWTMKLFRSCTHLKDLVRIGRYQQEQLASRASKRLTICFNFKYGSGSLLSTRV